MIQTQKRIWVDCDNSPHVLFFKPIIKELKKRGYKLNTTARDFSQTVPLLKRFSIEHEVIGRHYGKNKFAKIIGTFVRALQLLKSHRKEKFDLTVVHTSRALPVASFLKGIPNISMVDYEYIDLNVFKWFASKIFVPEVINKEITKSLGIPEKKIIRYPGYKENVYLYHFEPNSNPRSKLGIDSDKVLIVIRPPATMVHYHVKEGEYLFEKIVQVASSCLDAQVVLLFRTRDQEDKWREIIETLSRPPVIPRNAVSGLDLLYHSDLVISGGGTMAREAAIMGVPSFSIFKGKKGAVDADLETKGLLTFLNDEQDLSQLEFKRKRPVNLQSLRKKETFDFIVNQIEQMVM